MYIVLINYQLMNKINLNDDNFLSGHSFSCKKCIYFFHLGCFYDLCNDVSFLLLLSFLIIK